MHPHVFVIVMKQLMIRDRVDSSYWKNKRFYVLLNVDLPLTLRAASVVYNCTEYLKFDQKLAFLVTKRNFRKRLVTQSKPTAVMSTKAHPPELKKFMDKMVNCFYMFDTLSALHFSILTV